MEVDYAVLRSAGFVLFLKQTFDPKLHVPALDYLFAPNPHD